MAADLQEWGRRPIPVDLWMTSYTFAAGDTVTLYGKDFYGISSVTFSGTSASFTALSDTQISVVVPNDWTGTGTVVVVGEYGQASLDVNITTDDEEWYFTLDRP